MRNERNVNADMPSQAIIDVKDVAQEHPWQWWVPDADEVIDGISEFVKRRTQP
jgi:hypothetical protein